MSARISGVKNFESNAVSLLRGLPFSQVQSQSEKGSIFFGFAAAAVEESLADCVTIACAGTAAGATGGATSTVLAGLTATKGAPGAAIRVFNSASSSSMRAFIAANSFAISAGLAGSGAAAGRVGDTSGDTSGTAAASCTAATFTGASACAEVCA